MKFVLCLCALGGALLGLLLGNVLPFGVLVVIVAICYAWQKD